VHCDRSQSVFRGRYPLFRPTVIRVDPFFLSDNEWKRAREHADAYEIHFWGGIDLARQPADEFPVLRALGFPVVVTGIIDQVAQGVWCADAVRWRVYRAPAAPTGSGTSSASAGGGP
jgi:hypothetical protein